MSNWQTPKTNWGQPGQTVPGADDFNRIEENIKIIGQYDRAPGYGIAYGTNSKIITLNPAPTSYYEGMCFAFRNEVQNTGPVTINVNGLGARSIKKPNGNDLVSGNLKTGSVYTVRYNGTNFILQGSDSSGNATPGDVTAGKTFSNDDGSDQVGTMPIHDDQSTILTITGAEKPQKVIPAGRLLEDSTIIAELDPSLAPLIRENNNIGGVEGTFAGKRWATGIVNVSDYTLVISGLDFVPSLIVYYQTGGGIYAFMGVASSAEDIYADSLNRNCVNFTHAGGSPPNAHIDPYNITFGTTITIHGIPGTPYSSVPIRWWAFE